jgi:hypothetical protein
MERFSISDIINLEKNGYEINYSSENVSKNFLCLSGYPIKTNILNLDKVKMSSYSENNSLNFFRKIDKDCTLIIHPPGSGGNFLRLCLLLGKVDDKNEFINQYKTEIFNLSKNKFWKDIGINSRKSHLLLHYDYNDENVISKLDKILTQFKENKAIIINNTKLFFYLRKMTKQLDWEKFDHLSDDSKIIYQKILNKVWIKNKKKQLFDINNFYNLPKEKQKEIILFFKEKQKKIKFSQNSNYYWDANWFLYKKDFLHNIECTYNTLGLTEFDFDILGEMYDGWMSLIKSFTT